MRALVNIKGGKNMMFQVITGQNGRLKEDIHLRWAGAAHPTELQLPRGTVFQLMKTGKYCILIDGSLACGVEVWNENHETFVVPVDSIKILE